MLTTLLIIVCTLLSVFIYSFILQRIVKAKSLFFLVCVPRNWRITWEFESFYCMNLTHSFFTECRYTEAFVVNVRIALDELIWTSMIQHGCFFLLLVSVIMIC